MFHISGGSGLGFWITGADGDTIEYGLDPACNELQVSGLVAIALRYCECRHV